MPADAILYIMHGILVTGEAIKNLQAAKQFVSDYLYNQDIVTADVIINSEIRDHFKLKVSFLKSLNVVYKDASKAAKRTNAGTAKPDRYEPTYKGLRFLPGVLANDMSENQQVFYAAEQHSNYRSGVYCEMSEMEAQQKYWCVRRRCRRSLMRRSNRCSWCRVASAN